MQDSDITFDKNSIGDLLETINGLIELANGELIDTNLRQNAPEEPEEQEKNDPDSLVERGFFEPQIYEIERGRKQSLPIEVYAKTCYNWRQMYEIRKGLLRKLNIDLYSNPLFSAEQMHEIRIGLEEGLDVSSYAKLIYSLSDMSEKRRKLMEQKLVVLQEQVRHSFVDEDTGIEVRTSEDCMKAYVRIPDYQKKISLARIKRILRKYDVIYGVSDACIQEMLAKKISQKDVQVAEGTPAKNGADGWYKLSFKSNVPGLPKVLPDGSVDYSNVMVADMVMPQQVLAQYQPALQGKPGITVTGFQVQGTDGKELQPLTGQGILINEKQGIYVAACKGYVAYDPGKGTLNVFQTYLADGDITRYSGSIVFDGTVQIKGSVLDMSMIKASGDVIVDGFVSGGYIEAGNNVVLKAGVNTGGRGYIRAGGKIMGNFFESVGLSAGGIIEGNYFLDCEVETDAKLIAKGGKSRIMGSYVRAAVGVEAAVIGAEAGKRTIVEVGDLAELDKRAGRLEKKIENIGEEQSKLVEGREKLLALYGEEAVIGNKIYQKTCLAIELKAAELENVEQELERVRQVQEQAQKACIRAGTELKSNVTVAVNGKRVGIVQAMRGVTIDEEKVEELLQEKR